MVEQQGRRASWCRGPKRARTVSSQDSPASLELPSFITGMQTVPTLYHEPGCNVLQHCMLAVPTNVIFYMTMYVVTRSLSTIDRPLGTLQQRPEAQRGIPNASHRCVAYQRAGQSNYAYFLYPSSSVSYRML